MAQESTLHAIWSYEFLQQTWFLAFEWILKDLPNIQNLQELVQLIGQRQRRLEVFAIVAWFIQSRRNKLRLHESSLAPNRIFEAACNFLSEFQQKNPINIVLSSSKLVKWRPSSSEMYITNFDRAVFADTNEAGLSVVV